MTRWRYTLAFAGAMLAAATGCNKTKVAAPPTPAEAKQQMQEQKALTSKMIEKTNSGDAAPAENVAPQVDPENPPEGTIVPK